ncbi:type II toxin-antitoxin system VapC family toxin [Sphingomonas tabacisoli]|uniref:Type II toxin-antitoxin system VapC family toxin n=1 Tax=Sphingomonas tabacisoli TaxID=2249466 RepID=A0ABW4HY06_9SPHN
MSLFVDASAIVAMLAQENGADDLAARLGDAESPITSAVAMWEAVTALHRSYRYDLRIAADMVDGLIDGCPIKVVSIGGPEASLAMAAFSRFGKGRHKANLNMGDCFAYACAKAHGAKLLYKGDDFARTDLA